MADYYSILGVKRDATADEIKQAYRRMAAQHHPDRGGDTQKFQEVQQAYDTLSDDNRRAAYDNPGQQMFGGGGGGNPFDFFNQMFGGGFGGAGFHNRRSHVRMTMWVTFAEAVCGTNKTVQVGTTQGQSTIQVEVPAGIEDGDNVQYSGIAPGGMDLVIQYRVTPDTRWRRDGMNLHTEHRVPIWDLILGGDMKVQSIHGNDLNIRIPELCQPGTLLRARGQGVRPKNGQPGDLLVRVQAEIPRNIAPELLDAIRQHRS